MNKIIKVSRCKECPYFGLNKWGDIVCRNSDNEIDFYDIEKIQDWCELEELKDVN